jgi:hypothetical protein
MDVQQTRALSDLDLLEIEMDLLWGATTGPELLIACARDGACLRIAKHLVAEVARAVAVATDGIPPDADLDALPPQLERCRVLLQDALGAAVRLAPGSRRSWSLAIHQAAEPVSG